MVRWGLETHCTLGKQGHKKPSVLFECRPHLNFRTLPGPKRGQPGARGELWRPWLRGCWMLWL